MVTLAIKYRLIETSFVPCDPPHTDVFCGHPAAACARPSPYLPVYIPRRCARGRVDGRRHRPVQGPQEAHDEAVCAYLAPLCVLGPFCEYMPCTIIASVQFATHQNASQHLRCQQMCAALRNNRVPYSQRACCWHGRMLPSSKVHAQFHCWGIDCLVLLLTGAVPLEPAAHVARELRHLVRHAPALY